MKKRVSSMRLQSSHGFSKVSMVNFTCLRPSGYAPLAMHLLLVALCYFICLQLNRLFFSFLAPGKVYSVVLGYPLFRDFDINHLFNFYYAELVGVPLATWVLYVQLGSLLGWRPSPTRVGRGQGVQSLAVLGDAARLAAVGFFFSRLFPASPLGFWKAALLAAGTYSVGVAAAAWVLGRFTHRSVADWRATLNLLAVPFTVFGLAQLSSRSSAILDGKVVAIDWFPAAAVGFVFWVLWMVCVTRLFEDRRPVTGTRLREREKQALLAVLAPLFLFLPQVAGQPIVADLFHLGEATVPPTLLLQGKVPWRDFLFVHGLMEDALRSIPGMLNWGGIWGGHAGQTIWLFPLGMASLGLLYQRLLGANTAAVLIVLLFVLAPLKQVGFALHQRFLLEPLTLFACVQFYSKPSARRAAFFAFLTVCGLFTTGETFFFALAYAATTVLADIQSRKSGTPLLFCFRRTLLYGFLSFAFIGVGFGILAYFGALSPFLDFHLNTASGHRFSGGLPMPALEATFFLLNILAVAVAVLYGLGCWRRGQRLTPEELTMGAVAIFAIFYYQKFLSRADLPHFMIYWVPVTPLVYFILGRFLTAADDWLPRRFRVWFAHPISVVLLLLLLGMRSHEITEALQVVESQPVLETNPIDPKLGPFKLGAGIADSAHSLRSYFKARSYEGPVFDFSNEPLLFHYLLGMPIATRFPYVSLAIHPYLQTQLVNELAEARPRFVVYGKGPHGAWDGVHNMVRHYQVSRHLLDNYVPVAWVAEHLLLERADTGAKQLPGSTWEALSPCEWGSILANWSTPYTEAPASPAVKVSQVKGQWRSEIAVPNQLRGKGATLELFVESADEGRVDVQTPGGWIGWKMHAGKQRRYRVPLGSCPQWHALNSSLVLQHPAELKIVGTRWIAEPVKGFSAP
jgi:hypothetical protein